MTAQEHNKLVGVFLMAHGGLQAVIFIFLALVYGGIGSALVLGGQKQQDQFVGTVFLAMIAFLLVFALVFVTPQIIGGYKIFKRRPNARIWGIIASIVSCFSFPIGTAAGVYGMWFLFGDQGKSLYVNGSNPNMFQPTNPTPPKPGDWQ